MSDYNRYDFTIKESDLLRVMREAAAGGLAPMVYINGMFYNVQLEDIPPLTSADPDDMF